MTKARPAVRPVDEAYDAGTLWTMARDCCRAFATSSATTAHITAGGATGRSGSSSSGDGGEQTIAAVWPRGVPFWFRGPVNVTRALGAQPLQSLYRVALAREFSL